MHKRDKTIYISLVIMAGLILINMAAYHYGKCYHNKMMSYPKMYCYYINKNYNVIDPAFFVKRKQYFDSLLIYYERDKIFTTPNYINFPIHTVPTDTCVYLIGYEQDSTIAKIICYGNFGKIGPYIKGYIDVRTLHSIPPNKE